MCGIIGAISQDKPLTFSEDKFSELMKKMDYRGPDAQDQWVDKSNSIRLGHLRLSIQDPRPEGTQPMHHETDDGRYSIVFNGEVYNFKEIADELKKLGYTFKTKTDTEVILKAYIAWGTHALQRFNGMFAIAIYNDFDKKLFIARDRLGVKPVYYHHANGELQFASEVKALKPLVEDDTSVDPALLHQYMKFGYITGSKTLNTNINRLLPGHYMIYEKGTLSFSRYWSLEFLPDKKKIDKGLDAFVNEGKALFQSSLALRKRSDVPMGVFLSGGLDSSAVVAGLAQHESDTIKTFSVRFDNAEFGEGFDESEFAKDVSDKFQTEHKVITMTPKMFEDFIPKFVSMMDEPVTEAAAISLHFVSELAKDDVTVVLSGEGSDEIFAGYDLYRYMAAVEKIRNLITPWGARLLQKVCDKILPPGNKIRKYARLINLPFESRYKGISVYDTSHSEKLYKDSFKESDMLAENTDFGQTLFDKTKGAHIVDRMMHYDTHTWLVDDLLTKADRMSMGSSLELRVPFLDYRIVEFAARLPVKYKLNGARHKHILKEMMAGLLPNAIIDRKKLGFPTPLKLMFSGPLKGYVEKTLVENKQAKIAKYFDMDHVEKLCEEHFSEKHDHHRLLWQLIVLEEWLKQNT